jgi:DNA-binding NarL/FixJ family response regulator
MIGRSPVMRKAIRVLLADDTLIAREGWRTILETDDEMDVVGEAVSAQETLRKVRELKPDVVLMDLKWNFDTTAGWTAIREIKRSHPEVKVIAITAYENLIGDARRAGADAALMKTFSRKQLLDLIRELISRRERFPPAKPRSTPIDRLTEREKDVLSLLVDGYPDKQIAEALMIAESTAKNHVSSILSKLGANNRTHAAKIARDSGAQR